MQYRTPVGLGPSSNMWPRCELHFAHWTSVLFIPWESSGMYLILDLSMQSKNAGHPQPDSYLTEDGNKSSLQIRQEYMPLSLVWRYSPVPGGSVSFSWVTLHCILVSRDFRSSLSMAGGRLLCLLTNRGEKKDQSRPLITWRDQRAVMTDSAASLASGLLKVWQLQKRNSLICFVITYTIASEGSATLRLNHVTHGCHPWDDLVAQRERSACRRSVFRASLLCPNASSEPPPEGLICLTSVKRRLIISETPLTGLGRSIGRGVYRKNLWFARDKWPSDKRLLQSMEDYALDPDKTLRLSIDS